MKDFPVVGAALLDEALIEFSGSDVRAWLQGQITNDINLVDSQPGMEACICSPTGHIQAIIKIWPKENRLLISSPTVCLKSILDRVNRFVIMEDVVANSLDLMCIHVFGSTPTEHSSITLPSSRYGIEGHDCWLSEADAESFKSDLFLNSENLEALRIESGTPNFDADIGPKTLAPELGEAFVRRTISENKGCYVGQEVIHRIHSRGHTNRTWCFLRCESAITIGSDIVNDQGEVCGKVTSCAISPREGHIAAGMIRNKWTSIGTTLIAGGVQVTVEEFSRA